MKKLLSFFTALVISASAFAQGYNVEVCVNLSGPQLSGPVTATLTYYAGGVANTLTTTVANVQLPTTFCFPTYLQLPDSGFFAYAYGSIQLSTCGPAQSYNYSQSISGNQTINVSAQNCGSAANCSASISASNGVLTAAGTGVAPLMYSWDYGLTFSGNQYFQPNVSGYYCVIIQDATGCTDTACYNDTVVPGGCAASINTLPGTNGILTASSTGIPPFTYQWSNGATAQTITATTTGFYCVSITDNNGCTDTACYNYTGANLCGATIISGTDPITGADVLIAYADTNSFNAIYEWSVNGGVFILGQSTIIPSVPGNYCVSITYANGCVGTDCYAYNGPSASCSVIAYAHEDSLVSGLIYCNAYATGTAPFIYEWYFSDGTSSSLANPIHTFINSAANGNWAFVTVTDATGCVSYYSVSVYMNPPINNSCAAGFYSDANYQFGNAGEVFFNDYSTAIGGVTSYSWDFGDGSSSNLQNPMHIYTTTGNYYVCLTTTSGTGCTSSFCISTYVNLAWWLSNPFQGACTAGYLALPGGPNSGGLINIINTSQGNNLFYTWDFGNGIITNDPYPFVTFSNAGIYYVCLSITDTLIGCSDTFCDTLTVDSLGNISRADMIGNAALFVSASPMPNSLVSVQENGLNTSTEFVINPNPSNGIVTINTKGLVQGNTTVQVLDLSGQITYSKNINFGKDLQQTLIDLSNLADGMYLVKMIGQNEIQSTKIVIKH